MSKTQNETSGWTMLMRWIARLTGLVAAGLFVAFLFMSGTMVLPSLTWGPQGIPLFIALVAAIAGVLIAWKWELVGGILSIVGSLAIMALVCAGSGGDMLFCALLFTLPILVAGLLYLGCCWRKRSVSRAQKA
jgi:hypothetical protein